MIPGSISWSIFVERQLLHHPIRPRFASSLKISIQKESCQENTIYIWPLVDTHCCLESLLSTKMAFSSSTATALVCVCCLFCYNVFTGSHGENGENNEMYGENNEISDA